MEQSNHSCSAKQICPPSHNDNQAGCRRLYIGNLAYATTEEELKSFFAGYSVESTTIPTNPRTSRPVGYAFVELSSAEEAQKAVNELAGKVVLERKVSVQLARKPEKQIAVQPFQDGGVTMFSYVKEEDLGYHHEDDSNPDIAAEEQAAGQASKDELMIRSPRVKQEDSGHHLQDSSNPEIAAEKQAAVQSSQNELATTSPRVKHEDPADHQPQGPSNWGDSAEQLRQARLRQLEQMPLNETPDKVNLDRAYFIELEKALGPKQSGSNAAPLGHRRRRQSPDPLGALEASLFQRSLTPNIKASSGQEQGQPRQWTDYGLRVPGLDYPQLQQHSAHGADINPKSTTLLDKPPHRRRKPINAGSRTRRHQVREEAFGRLNDLDEMKRKSATDRFKTKQQRLREHLDADNGLSRASRADAIGRKLQMDQSKQPKGLLIQQGEGVPASSAPASGKRSTSEGLKRSECDIAQYIGRKIQRHQKESEKERTTERSGNLREGDALGTEHNALPNEDYHHSVRGRFQGELSTPPTLGALGTKAGNHRSSLTWAERCILQYQKTDGDKWNLSTDNGWKGDLTPPKHLSHAKEQQARQQPNQAEGFQPSDRHGIRCGELPSAPSSSEDSDIENPFHDPPPHSDTTPPPAPTFKPSSISPPARYDPQKFVRFLATLPPAPTDLPTSTIAAPHCESCNVNLAEIERTTSFRYPDACPLCHAPRIYISNPGTSPTAPRAMPRQSEVNGSQANAQAGSLTGDYIPAFMETEDRKLGVVSDSGAANGMKSELQDSDVIAERSSPMKRSVADETLGKTERQHEAKRARLTGVLDGGGAKGVQWAEDDQIAQRRR